MSKLIGALLVFAFVLGLSSGPVRAADPPDALIAKAIKAIGGQEKIAKAKGFTWKTKGTISFNGEDNPTTGTVTVQGLDHRRQDFEGEFGGNPIKGQMVLAGEKGWRDFADNHQDMEKDDLANEKRTLYLELIPVTIVPLQSKDFKVEAIAEEIKVGDKPAVGVKVTAPDSKDFSLYFDKESGLPVRLVAKVIGFDGQEFTQETTFSDYKEMGGIQKATKVSSKRDGEKFIDSQILEFQILEMVDPKTFEAK